MFIHRTVYAALLTSCFLVVPIHPATAACDPDCDCDRCRLLDQCVVIGTTPTTITVRWRWTPPNAGISPQSATVYVSLNPNGQWEPGGDDQYEEGSEHGQCTVTDLVPGTTYHLKVLEIMSDFTTNSCVIQNGTTTQLNYYLLPNANDTAFWYINAVGNIDEEQVDLNDFIEARASSEDNEVEQRYNFGDPPNSATWGIKRVVVSMYAERDGSIDPLEVNISIDNQPGTSQQVSLPLTFPSIPQTLTFVKPSGTWTRSQLETLKVIFIAHGVDAGTHRARVAQVYVQTFEN